MIRLSIIIVSYNVKFYVQQCIEAIHNSTFQDFEIIIVDNNSSDGSSDFLEQKYGDSIQLIKNIDNKGFGTACNQGLRIATGEYTLFLNPDTILTKTTLENCIHFAMDTKNLGLLGVRMVNKDGTFLAESKRGFPSPKASFFRLTSLNSILTNSQTANAYYAPHIGEFDVAKVDVISGAFMFCSTDKLKELKGFDEDYFMYGEDVDLSYKSIKAGLDNYYLGTETIIHHKGKSTDKTNPEYVNRFYGAMSIFHKKHVKDSYSWFFNVLISIAIFARKMLSGIGLFLKKSFLPLVELGLFIGGGFVIKYLWSRFYFENVGYYQDSGATINLIAYNIFWVLVLYFGSSYRHDRQRSTAMIQLLIGLIIILVFYSVLPMEWRSSRALIGFYFLWNAVVLMVSRTLMGSMKKQDFKIGERIGVVASPVMIDELNEINTSLKEDAKTLVSIRPSATYSSTHYIEDFENIIQFSKEHSLDSVLISVQEFQLTEVKTNVEILKEYGIQAAIIDQFDMQNVLTGQMRHKTLLDSKQLDFNILFWENKIMKRTFDVIFGILLLPVSLIHSQLDLSNLLHVILNKKSLIGYQMDDREVHKLPILKTGVIPVTRQRGIVKNIHDENLDYALYYSVFNDFKHLVSFLV